MNKTQWQKRLKGACEAAGTYREAFDTTIATAGIAPDQIGTGDGSTLAAGLPRRIPKASSGTDRAGYDSSPEVGSLNPFLG